MSDCGCCEPGTAAIGDAVANRPGLRSLAFRTGTHGRFLAAMRDAIASQPELAVLGTRESDDPTVAMLDAWATVLDVLTFYNERIIDEGFLRTSTERRSLLELARAIGYELNPGVAASTVLAFTLEPAPGSPTSTKLVAGTRAQSVPAQDKLPAIFETTAEIEARTEWNQWRVRVVEPAVPVIDDTDIWIDGIGANIRPGDAVLLIGDERAAWAGSERWDFRRVVTVEEVPEKIGGDADGVPAHTVVTVDHPLGTHTPRIDPSSDGTALYVLRTRASLFGHNAVLWHDLPLPLRVGENNPKDGTFIAGPYAGREHSWADAPFPAGTTQVWLDHVYDHIAVGSWAVLNGPDYTEVYRVDAVTEAAHTDFLLSATATRLTVSGEHIDWFSPRDAVAFAQSERHDLAPRPITAAVTGERIVLDRHVDGLERGHLVVVSGVRVDTGEADAEAVVVDTVEVDGDATALRFERGLVHGYEPRSVRVYGNVAPATHGQSWQEVLGSGDGRAAFATYTLRNAPLTYTAAVTAAGSQPTLEIRVDGIRWHQVPSLYGQAADARVYVVRIADNGAVSVRFGDGVTGARLPSGQDNVVATYRVGTGLAGQTDRGAITLPLSMPLGLKSVVNPLPATGAEDPEGIEAARANAGLTVRTLDRIVSVRDVEDFARAFAGIGKAAAAVVWQGERRVIHLTVAAADGTPVDPTGDLYAKLVAAVDAARFRDQPVVVAGHHDVHVGVVAAVRVDPDRVPADVLDLCRRTLVERFSFAARAFGQGVTRSEVYAVLQGVAGVTGVVLHALGDVTEAGTGPGKVHDIVAHLAHLDGAVLAPADLVTVDATAITLTEYTP